MYWDEYTDDGFLSSLNFLLPFFIVISYVIPVCRMISQIVQEKETKSKEMMMMMGMSQSAYWASWLIYYFSIYTVIAIFNTILMSTQVFPNSDGGLIFLMFWLFGLCCMAFSTLVTVFFSRGRTAVMIGLMIFFVQYFVSFAVDDPKISENQKNAASLLPLVAFRLSMISLIEYEIGGKGIQTDNASDSYENYMFSTSLIFYVVDAVIFYLLAWYLEQVWPTEYGVKQPPYFLFTKRYWFGNKIQEQEQEEFNKTIEWGDNVESVDPSLEQQKLEGKAMIIRGLVKQFGNKTAVDGLDLDIYNGQIFGLLGHNGAGKTTTISMLTGLIPPTQGDMLINGMTIRKNLQDLRKKLGVCPQHNVIFPNLTVREHLYVFAVFKGMKSKTDILNQIDDKVKQCDLESSQNKQAYSLSGGQKRKLCLAMALIADSPIVLLDEPTSGMDLTARRLMWDMLKNNKANRIIILTTHYMEEADVLSDRIAIMSEGKLRCCGSSLFLKNRFGVGYSLTMVKQQDVASDSHTQRVAQFVSDHIPEAKCTDDIHAEITFRLPLHASAQFRDLFENLDRQLNSLQIVSYGISVTTLEEVFLRVARGDDIIAKADDYEEDEETDVNEFVLERDRIQGSLLFFHFYALLKKRVLITMRDSKSLIFEIMIPILLVLGGLGLMMINDRFVDQDSYKLSISKYDETQNIMYSSTPNLNVQQLIQIMGTSADVDFTEVPLSSTVFEERIIEFDKILFDERDTDPYRMGSLYFEEFDTVNHHYNFVVFHNMTAFQAVGTYYQLVSNAILKNIDASHEQTVYNHPLPLTENVKSLNSSGDGFLAGVIFSLGFAFIPAGIIAFIVLERENSIKHQHTISGVSLTAYWMTNYTWDIVKHILPTVVCALLILAFDIETFTDDSDDYGAVWVLMILFGVAIAPFTYVTSFLFKSHATAQIITILFHFVCGSILPMVILTMYFFSSTRDVGKALRWVFRLVPSFCFGNGLFNVGMDIFAVLDGEDSYDAFEIDGAGADILFLGIDTIIYVIMLIIGEYIETSPTVRQLCNNSQVASQSQDDADTDVQHEAQLAIDASPEAYQINVKNLVQVYGNCISPKVFAVKGVSFNVPRGECFALLGVNGAGKTSTFRMLTGEYSPTSGEAYLGGINVIKDLSQARRLIGYCPQFDAISELLTGREHLELYCAIKGIPKTHWDSQVKYFLRDMDLTQYENIKAGTYSGGNKRKLSTAMALIGNPSVVFMDEPSAGMDPEARKKMWKILGNIKKKNAAVILTTHSMEEAESLSNRMTIMVNGRLRCLGSSTHIKNKYGKGYELEIKVKMPSKTIIAEQAQKLSGLLQQNGTLHHTKLNEALQILGAMDLRDDITEDGPGAPLFQLLKVDGQISPQTLISWALIEHNGDQIHRWISTHFNEVELLEHYLALFKFRVEKQSDKSLGFLFSAIEQMKAELNISEYALSQTSLEQIFNTFAREEDSKSNARRLTRRMSRDDNGIVAQVS